MGLQLTVTVFIAGASREQSVCEDFPRDKYCHLPLITGMTPEGVSKWGWSQVVGYETARAICQVAKMAPQFASIAPAHLKNAFLIRATIA